MLRNVIGKKTMGWEFGIQIGFWASNFSSQGVALYLSCQKSSYSTTRYQILLPSKNIMDTAHEKNGLFKPKKPIRFRCLNENERGRRFSTCYQDYWSVRSIIARWALTNVNLSNLSTDVVPDGEGLSYALIFATWTGKGWKIQYWKCYQK